MIREKKSINCAAEFATTDPLCEFIASGAIKA